MKTLNQIVLIGLVVSGIAPFFLLSFLADINAINAAVIFAYIMVIYSMVAFVWVGILFAIRLDIVGFFKTLYPLNALIAFIDCLIVLYV